MANARPLKLLGRLLAGGLGLALLSGGRAIALCPAQLTPQLDAALNQPPLDTAYTGMVLQTQGPAPRTLYSRNGDRLFTPASNIKLLTTAAALHRLGGDYRLRTSIYSANADSTTLRVMGQGDPTVTDAELDALAQQIAQAGVQRVSLLVVDDSYFPGFATNPTWEWGDAQFAFAAPVNSLILNRNAIAVQIAPTQVGSPLSVVVARALPAGPLAIVNDSLTVASGSPTAPLSIWRSGDSPTLRVTGQMALGSNPRTLDLAVLNPAQQFAAALQQALQQRSIPVGQTVITQTPTSAPGSELAALLSPPLGELLMAANRDSDNLYAEVLFKTLGITAGGTVSEASQAGGAAVKTVLAALGVNSDPLRLADGSGLSRHNLVSPIALVETLQAMAEHPQRDIFRASLAIAGQSGTLRNRFVGTVLDGRVQGKTGALTGNVSLSGYLQPPNYDPLVFSIVINHSNQHASVLREKIDALLQLVAQLQPGC
jgi:serine-type D-Ala-D-Ala carboxypeptidase/endopeptidase (penicillin-binding protein 4)